MEPIHVIIIICTLINIAGFVYLYKTSKDIEHDKILMKDAAKDIMGMVVKLREDMINDLEELKPKSPYMPSQKEIDEVLDEEDNE